MANDINGGLRNVLPGPLDFLRGPYDSLATANGAIPSVVVGGKNFREGKFVEIGTNGVFETYWWSGSGQYLNSDLVKYVEDPDLTNYAEKSTVYTKDQVYTKAETLPASQLYNKTQVYTKSQVDQAVIGLSPGSQQLIPIFDSKLAKVSINDVRLNSSTEFFTDFYTTDEGKEGTWRKLDGTYNQSQDNGGFLIVDTLGNGYQRVIEGSVYASWFLKADGVTDETTEFQSMLDFIPENTTINFGGIEKVYLYTSVRVTKRFIQFIGNGAVMKGTIICGVEGMEAPVTLMNFTSKGLRFDFSGSNEYTRNAFELVNMRGFYIDETYCTRVKAVIYVKPLDKFQHVNRGYIKNTHGEGHYLVFADNPINTAPYTGIQMSLGDIEVSGNSDFSSRVTCFLGFGVDGLTCTNNTFFMTGWDQKTQEKNQNIRIVAGNWIRIIGNSLFEAGLESILLEKCTQVAVIGNNIAWPGQRDVNFGYGIRITGRGYPDGNYQTSTISLNTIALPTRSAIRLDAQSSRVGVKGNVGMSIGNPNFYYGNGSLPVGDPNIIPSINSVSHYMVETDITCTYCTVGDNDGDNGLYSIAIDTASNMSPNAVTKTYNNNSTSGLYEHIQAAISTISATGEITAPHSDNVFLNITAGGTIKNVTKGYIGETKTFYNNSTNVIWENNANIQLANDENFTHTFKACLTLQRRADKWYEVSRTQAYPEAIRNYKFTRPTQITTAKDAIVAPNPAFDLFYTTAPFRVGIRFALDNNRTFKRYISIDDRGKIYSAFETSGTWSEERRLSFARKYTEVSASSTKLTNQYDEIFVNTSSSINSLTLGYDIDANPGTVLEFINPQSSPANFIIIPNDSGTAMSINGVTGSAGQVVLLPGEKLILVMSSVTSFRITSKSKIDSTVV